MIPHKVPVLAALFFLAAVLLPCGQALADPGTLSKLAKARFQAAQEAYRQKLDEDKRTGYFDPEGRYTWSKRLLDAQREMDQKIDEQILALKAHLERMTTMDKFAKQMWDQTSAESKRSGTSPYISLLQVAAAAFFRAEAELWLARAEEKK